MDRVPAETRTAIDAIERQHLQMYSELKLMLHGSEDVPPAIGRQLYKQLTGELAASYLRSLDEILSNCHFLERAWCLFHEDFCCVSPRREFPNHRWLDVMGFICVAWSSAGNGDGWLHPSTKLTMVTAYSARYYEPDEIFTECSPSFDAATVTRIFGKQATDVALKHECSRPLHIGEESRWYSEFCRKHSPHHSGVPARRLRCYQYFRLNTWSQ